MIRIQRYLLGDLLSAFLLLTGIVTGVFVAGSLLQFLHKNPELGIVVLLRVMPYLLPSALVVTVPLAFLVACLLTYGRFSDDNEFVAFRMGGIHPWHAIAPALLTGLALTFMTLELNGNLAPLASVAAKTIARDQAGQVVAVLQDSGATRLQTRHGFEMSWADREAGGWVREVLISVRERELDPRTGKRIDKTQLLWADRARLRPPDEHDQLLLELEGAHVERPDALGNHTWVEYDRTALRFDLAEIAGVPENMKSKGASERASLDLLYVLSRGSPSESFRREIAAEYWWRISLGLSPLVFGLIGSIMGLVTARGSRATAVVTGVMLALPIYYPVLLWGRNLASDGTLPPALALNLANLLLVAIALVYARRVNGA